MGFVLSGYMGPDIGRIRTGIPSNTERLSRIGAATMESEVTANEAGSTGIFFKSSRFSLSIRTNSDGLADKVRNPDFILYEKRSLSPSANTSSVSSASRFMTSSLGGNPALDSRSLR